MEVGRSIQGFRSATNPVSLSESDRRSATSDKKQAGESQPGPLDLDQIIKDSNLNLVEWVRIAKARAAEALFLERLLKTARELLSFAN